MAQTGSALAWGASGRRFKSGHPDHFNLRTAQFRTAHGRAPAIRRGGPSLPQLSQGTAIGFCSQVAGSWRRSEIASPHVCFRAMTTSRYRAHSPAPRSCATRSSRIASSLRRAPCRRRFGHSARVPQPYFWQEVPMYFHTEGFGPYERNIVPFKILPSGETW